MHFRKQALQWILPEKTHGMHFYYCNLFKHSKKSKLSMYSAFKSLPQIHLYFVCHLPAIRLGSATCTGLIFLTNNVIGDYNTNLLFRKRFIHCAMMIPFILHWPSLLFCNSRKKVSITPGLYFPNYCVTYLSRDISRDFNIEQV